jgi:hypothetical protein
MMIMELKNLRGFPVTTRADNIESMEEITINQGGVSVKITEITKKDAEKMYVLDEKADILEALLQLYSEEGEK